MRESTAAQKGFLKNRREKPGASPALFQHGRNREVLVNCLKKFIKSVLFKTYYTRNVKKCLKKTAFFKAANRRAPNK